MVTLTCRHKGCAQSFSKSTEKKAVSARNMHETMKHGRWKNHKPAQAAGGGHEKNGAETPAATRKYKKRPQVASVTVNFCPRCGCDIHKVALGIILAERVKA